MLAGPRTKGACVATGHKVWGILNAQSTGDALSELIAVHCSEQRSDGLHTDPPSPARPIALALQLHPNTERKCGFMVRSEGGEDVSNFNNLPGWVKRQVHFAPIGAFQVQAPKAELSATPFGGAPSVPQSVSVLGQAGCTVWITVVPIQKT